MGICLIHMTFPLNKTTTIQQWQAVITMIAVMKILIWRRRGEGQITTMKYTIFISLYQYKYNISFNMSYLKLRMAHNHIVFT